MDPCLREEPEGREERAGCFRKVCQAHSDLAPAMCSGSELGVVGKKMAGIIRRIKGPPPLYGRALNTPLYDHWRTSISS